MLKIGINGFGRIGRVLLRYALANKNCEVVAINDLDSDFDNLAYLLEYDTTYGKLNGHHIKLEKDILHVNQQQIKIFSKAQVDEIPWADFGAEYVIDATGVQKNVILAKNLMSQGIKKAIITHAPKTGTDFTMIHGVNEHLYNKDLHHVISSSICDANAVAPFYHLIESNFGVELGEISTLHPWLSYQNLLDGTLKSVSSPGHTWTDYALGRSSIGSLIPKATTLTDALGFVFGDLNSKIHSMSFRTPTSIVSAADGVFMLKKSITRAQLEEAVQAYVKQYPNVITLSEKSLISIDYMQTNCGANLDLRWLHLNNGRLLKFVLWYDNEWGYVSRVFQVLDNISK